MQTTSEPGYWNLKELMKRYEVQKDALNKRIVFLGFEPIKRGNKGRSLYSLEQVRHMDDLHLYIKKNGMMAGFPVPKLNEPSEHVDTVPESTESPTQTAIIPLVEGETGVEIETDEEFIPVESVSPHMIDEEMEAIDRQAQYIAAKRYIATQDLVDYYVNTGEFSIPEVKETVRFYRGRTQQQWEAAHKSADPKALSQILITRAKQRAGKERTTRA
ncbi:MAG: hypothetical protein PUP91_25210 [Rhizonema sp. PD37]|nr:hypothetical protein [Rhizonema sp. PD37]